MFKYFSCIFFIFLSSSCDQLYTKLGGNFSGPPATLKNNLPPNVKKIIEQSLNGLGDKPIIDLHAHLIGLGTNNSQAFVSSHMQSPLNLMKYIRFEVYKNASGIHHVNNSDLDYVERLVDLVRTFPHPIKVAILAFDKHYTKQGRVDLELTEFFVSNEYMYSVYKKYPDIFIPVISIHPYRQDAISELNRWAELGVRYIKWLPNSMGIDPADSALITYYEEIKRLNMIIITHVGEEKAVDGEKYQALGNPLKFRLPLNMGVKIIMAHAATLGTNIDFENKTATSEGPMVTNFELFLRLINDKKYLNNLWADISTITQFNRYKTALSFLINETLLHSRLINGSDYPLPAINFVIRTKVLAEEKFISEEEREALNYIYQYNPLLFDFVLKRIIKDPKTNRSFSPSLFQNTPI